MRITQRMILIIAGCTVLGALLAGCGEKKEKAEEKVQTQNQVAAKKEKAVSFDEEAPEIQALVTDKGYEVTSYAKFPAQEVGRKGRVILYKKGKSGGVIYLKKAKDRVAPVWHWFYSEMVPKSVESVELNEDGLWDIRIVGEDGRQFDYIQDESFTLMAQGRSDWLSMNGLSSYPSTAGEAMWKCFDGDSTTAWRSSFAGNDQVFLEFIMPFGVDDGILTVRTMSFDQPKVCRLFADGAEVQELTFEPREAVQKVHLDSSVKGKRIIRLVVESAHGKGDGVSIAELALR